jgi:4-amino-4-deoxy-L-arabinose transferase-like glycosyltransferase
MPARSPSLLATARRHWAGLALAVLAGVVALWARHALFPGYSWNRDEPVYLWQVDLLRQGQLTATDGGFPKLFHPWLSARGDGTIYSQYTLGWPLVLLAAEVLTGSAIAAPVFGASLAVAGTYAFAYELLSSRRVATVASALMVASPILAIQGGVHLSYLFTLGVGLLFATALMRGTTKRRPVLLVTAGGLLGWIFLTRPYDAVLWGLAAGLYVLVVERSRWSQALPRLLVAAACAVPLVVVGLAHNHHVTGAWMEFPITAADPLDTFGFGGKRLMPGFDIFHYGPRQAVRATLKNAALFPWFLVGSYGGLLLAMWGLWTLRRQRSVIALLLIAAVFPLGYIVFWGNHLSSEAARISGPIYFVPLYAPACILMAEPLVRWWSDRRARAIGVAVALAVITVPLAANRFSVNHDNSAQQLAWRDSTSDLQGPAIVFVADTAPYLMYLNPYSRNAPDLDGEILYANADSPAMLDLIAARPERTPYLQVADVASQELGPREEPVDLHVALLPIVVHRDAELELVVHVSADADAAGATLAVTTSEGAALPVDGGPAGPDGTTVSVPLRTAEEAGAVALDERGILTVTLDLTPGAERPSAVRVRLPYRVVAGELEVLTPGEAQRLTKVGDTLQWHHAAGLPELGVTMGSATVAGG